MKLNKKTCRWLAVLVLTALAGMGATYAYLTYSTYIRNRFTVAHSELTVDEEFTPPSRLETGENLTHKKVQIQNTGNVESYIRVFMDFSDSAVKDLSKISPNPDRSGLVPAAEYPEHLPDGWEYITEAEDPLLGGYYYYTEPVKGGDSTTPLMEWIVTTFENDAQIQDFEVIVYSEAVQTKIYEEVDGEIVSVEDLSGRGYRYAWSQFLGEEEMP